MRLLPIPLNGCLALLVCTAVATSHAAAADAPKPVDKPPTKADKPAAPEKSTDKAPDKTDGKPAKGANAKGAMPAELTHAVDALTAEFETAIKDPSGSGTVRIKSDYFGKESTVKVSQDDLLAALNKRLHKDPRVDAYIKWQLMSVQKEPFDDAHVKEAAKLLQRSGFRPLPRPGATMEEQGKLKTEVARLKKDDLESFNAKWQQHVGFHSLQYRPMYALREELYARMPKSPEVFALALNDMNERVQAGYDVTPFLRVVLADIRATAAGMKVNEIRQLGGMLQQYSGKTGNKPYETLQLNKDGRTVEWKVGNAVGFDKTLMTDVVQALNEMAKAG